MVWEFACSWRKKSPLALSSTAFKESFRVLAIALLTLLLPLSFLILARLSCIDYYSTVVNLPDSVIAHIIPFPFSVFFYTNPTLLHALVSILTACTLWHCLTGRKITFLSEPPVPAYQPPLAVAWLILCTLQVGVGLGIEGTITAGVNESHFNLERSMLSKIVFFLGLHETTLYWSRVIVKPVVDDTVFGSAQPAQGWPGKAAVAVGFGWLWWWKLREEVEGLVIVPEMKRELVMVIGMGDFVGWWLYYLTVTIGMVRIVKGLMWVSIILFCRKVKEDMEELSLEEEIV